MRALSLTNTFARRHALTHTRTRGTHQTEKERKRGRGCEKESKEVGKRGSSSRCCQTCSGTSFTSGHGLFKIRRPRQVASMPRGNPASTVFSTCACVWYDFYSILLFKHVRQISQYSHKCNLFCVPLITLHKRTCHIRDTRYFLLHVVFGVYRGLRLH